MEGTIPLAFHLIIYSKYFLLLFYYYFGLFHGWSVGPFLAEVLLRSNRKRLYRAACFSGPKPQKLYDIYIATNNWLFRNYNVPLTIHASFSVVPWEWLPCHLLFLWYKPFHTDQVKPGHLAPISALFYPVPLISFSTELWLFMGFGPYSQQQPSHLD